MCPNIAFGMILGRLLYALHARHFGEQQLEQSEVIQKFESSFCSTFREDSHEFLTNSLRSNLRDALPQMSDRLGCLRFDGET